MKLSIPPKLEKSIELSYRWIITLALLLTTSCNEDPLMEIDLTSILLQTGDLPHNLKPGATMVASPSSEVFSFEQAIGQKIMTKQGTVAGTVWVHLIRSKSDREEAYWSYSLWESQEGIEPFHITDVGDRASARHTDKGGIAVTFIRCYAVAAVWIEPTEGYEFNPADVLYYVERLDERLAMEVCP